MTNPTNSLVIKSTADLSPDGILGYAKGIAFSISAVLVVIVEFLPDGDYKRWTQGAIVLLGAIAGIQIPNAVQPVVVPPPATNVDPEAEHVGQHEAPEGPAPIVGVVQPPSPPADGQ